MRKTKEKLKNSNYSVINELKEKKLIDDRFLLRISNLTLEEIIAVKLESFSEKMNGKLYGIQIARAVRDIVKESLTKYALSVTNNKTGAALFLGITPSALSELIRTIKNREEETEIEE